MIYLFCIPPTHLNEIEFTVKFWQKKSRGTHIGGTELPRETQHAKSSEMQGLANLWRVTGQVLRCSGCGSAILHIEVPVYLYPICISTHGTLCTGTSLPNLEVAL